MSTRFVVLGLLADIQPFDQVERQHCRLARSWLEATSDFVRRVKPATPSPHLVSYVVPVDRQAQTVFLVAHRLAGLWLPPGGHVDTGEHPAATATRESAEELGVLAIPTVDGWQPTFLTWTDTRGAGQHVDVSLWFELDLHRGSALTLDEQEFSDGRWWTYAEVLAEARTQSTLPTIDPHLGRFVEKMAAVSR